MSTATQTKTRSAAKAAPAIAQTVETEAPKVKPEHIRIDAGVFDRRVEVRMPEGSVADDLRDPKIWKKVQTVPACALIKYDELRIYGHDESWAAHAVVVYATNAEACLQVLKIFNFRAVNEGLFSDGKHEVYWDGASYLVRRCSDKVAVISVGYSSEGLAIDALKQLSPTRLAQ